MKDHNSSGGMVVDDGHGVVVCKDCFSSLRDQVCKLKANGSTPLLGCAQYPIISLILRNIS